MATELERLAAAGTESSLARYSMRDDAGGEPSYEDMCKAHIEAFINAAAAAEVQTELASRCARARSRGLNPCMHAKCHEHAARSSGGVAQSLGTTEALP